MRESSRRRIVQIIIVRFLVAKNALSEDAIKNLQSRVSSSFLYLVTYKMHYLYIFIFQCFAFGIHASIPDSDQEFSGVKNLSSGPASNLEYALNVIPLDVEESLKKHIHWDASAENRIGYLYIGDRESSINQSTWLYIKQGLNHYKKNPPIFIILEIDTPGGEVFAAQKISDALKEIDIQYHIPVIAYINNWAISAGAMVAYACRYITTVKDASMGAAEPVLTDESGKLETASEKINSAMRSDFASRAGFFDRNPLIAEAMVDKDMILVMRQGKIIRLDNDNQIHYSNPDPDIMISPKGKLLTLNAEKMFEYKVADLILPPGQLSLIEEEERSIGQWPASKMALFQAPFFSAIPKATIHAYQMDWKTHFFVFLANPIVSSLLLMGLIVGAYLEFQHPGLSFPGLIACTCLFLMILSSFALQLGSWLELILLFTGLALMIGEIFLLPSMGILLGLGGILFLIGLFGLLIPGLGNVGYEPDSQTLNAAGLFALEKLVWLSGAFILSGVVIIILARYFLPNFKGLNRLVLSGDEQDASKGFIAPNAPKTLPQPGIEGIVLATLRPAGKVMIADQVYDAISPGRLIEANVAIVVLRLEGSVIVVTPKEGNLTL